MRVTRLTTGEGFLEKTEEYLLRAEAAHGLMLGLAGRIARGEPVTGPGTEPLLLAVEERTEVQLVLLCTPPRQVILAGYQVTDRALDALAGYLIDTAVRPPGVIALEPLATRFADLWARRTGCDRALSMGQRVYRLTAVQRTPSAPGRARWAEPPDAELVADWSLAFNAEAGPESHRPSRQETLERAHRRVAMAEVLLWEDPDAGGPVSMAAGSRPTRNGILVGGVYTPPERRRRGYATSCVATLSERLLEKGHAFCALYTDLSNPTSNSIYRKIGYRPVADSAMHRFEYRGEARP